MKKLLLIVVALLAVGCQTEPDPLEQALEVERAVRDTVAAYVTAARKGDRAGVAAVTDPDSAVPAQMYEMKQVSGDTSAHELRVLGSRALAITRPVNVQQPKGPMRAQLVFTLEMDATGYWRINDIDVEDPQGVADEIARFEAAAY